MLGMASGSFWFTSLHLSSPQLFSCIQFNLSIQFSSVQFSSVHNSTSSYSTPTHFTSIHIFAHPFFQYPDDATETDRKDLLKELKLMADISQVDHPNIVQMLGACSKGGTLTLYFV